MKRFVAGLLCGTGIGAATTLVAAVLVGLRVRLLEAEAQESTGDHH